MTMPLVGASPSRDVRKSDLIFGWRASDLTLRAYTGQWGIANPYVNVGALPTSAQGRNDNAALVGVGQNRWDQATARGTTVRLGLEGEVTGQIVEDILVAWPLKVMAMSMYWRVWPMYTVGQNLATPAWGPMIGESTVGGGWWGIRRSTTNWQAVRNRQGVEIVSTLTDIGSVFPIDVLITLSLAGVLQLSLRDATSTRVGATATNAAMTNVTETWGGSRFSWNGVQGLVAPGGRWWYEAIKIARGVQTFPSVDALN